MPVSAAHRHPYGIQVSILYRTGYAAGASRETLTPLRYTCWYRSCADPRSSLVAEPTFQRHLSRCRGDCIAQTHVAHDLDCSSWRPFPPLVPLVGRHPCLAGAEGTPPAEGRRCRCCKSWMRRWTWIGSCSWGRRGDQAVLGWRRKGLDRTAQRAKASYHTSFEILGSSGEAVSVRHAWRLLRNHHGEGGRNLLGLREGGRNHHGLAGHNRLGLQAGDRSHCSRLCRARDIPRVLGNPLYLASPCARQKASSRGIRLGAAGGFRTDLGQQARPTWNATARCRSDCPRRLRSQLLGQRCQVIGSTGFWQ